MTIQQSNVVDFVAFRQEDENAFLIIVDHLDWDEEEGEHLWLLQEKLNTYLAFIEGGQLVEEFPGIIGKAVTIKVKGIYPLSEQAKNFFNLSQKKVAEAGAKLCFELSPELDQ
jgi:hypothetical protein